MATSGESGAGLLALTFGVELELAFGISRLKVIRRPHLEYLFPQNYQLDPMDQVDDHEKFDPTDHENRGLCQAATVLRREGVDLAIKINPKDDDDLFQRWSLTHEKANICPAADWEIESYTDHRVRRLWDLQFSGLELISPIMQAPDMKAKQVLEGGSFQELEKVLKVIDFAQCHTDLPWMFLSKPQTSGFHVHVGLQPDEDWGPVDIPLEVLRHLAWIVVVFEDVVSLLHHPERRGFWMTKIYDHACSNRRAFLDINLRRVKTHLHTCDSGLVYDRYDAFNQIFGSRSHRELRDIMSNEPDADNPAYRNTFVNFYNISTTRGHPEPIRTVEFRQHCGTTDPTEVKEWVYFVTSLMRTAERKANEPTPTLPANDVSPSGLTSPQKLKYCDILNSKEKRTLKELFDLMELPVERRRYWWSRAQEYQSPKYEEYWKYGTCHPVCVGHVTRDAEGWAEGEVIAQPW
ncbi:uncharacterized protein A1O9_01133, partial [Exophiala aquamarina CBS 119918]